MTEGFILDYNLDDVPDLVVAEEGEHLLTVLNVAHHDSDKNGNPFLMVLFSVGDAENTKTVSHFIGLPGGKDSKPEADDKLRRLGYFCDAFNISLPIDVAEMEDKQGSAILKISEDEEYGEQNKIRRFVAPK